MLYWKLKTDHGAKSYRWKRKILDKNNRGHLPSILLHSTVPSLNHHSIAIQLARCPYPIWSLRKNRDFRFVSAQARLWLDHLQVFPLFQPSFFLAVWYDSQPRIQRQSRQRWHRPPSSSQNSITNVLIVYLWQDIQKSTSSIPAALRKCPVGATKNDWTEKDTKL